MPVANRKTARKIAAGNVPVANPSRGNRLSAPPETATATKNADLSENKTARAKLFQNGRSQAVRLPKEFRFEGKEVQIKRQGEGLLLMPVSNQSPQQYWSKLFQELDKYKHLDFPDCEDDTVTEPEDIFPENW